MMTEYAPAAITDRHGPLALGMAMPSRYHWTDSLEVNVVHNWVLDPSQNSDAPDIAAVGTEAVDMTKLAVEVQALLMSVTVRVYVPAALTVAMAVLDPFTMLPPLVASHE